jgi:hypothetical protein
MQGGGAMPPAMQGRGGAMPPGMQGGGAMPPGMQGGGAMPPGMQGGPTGGIPGAQAQEADQNQQEKGKQGNYEIWTKDNILALGFNLNLTPAQYAAVGNVLEIQGIYIRSLTAMSDQSSHIHELAAATQAYLAKNGHFPRGTVPRALDAMRAIEWRPDQRLSWMTQLLPYLANGEFNDVYKMIDTDENRKKAWYEDAANIKAGVTVIPHYVAQIKTDNQLYFYVPYPNLPVKGLWAATHYVGMAGVGLDAAEYRDGEAATAKKRGVFGYDRETKKADIKDGLEQTIVLIQVPPEPKSPWIAGGGSTVRGVSEDRDCVQPFVSTEYQGKPGTFAIMADGKVRFIPATINPETFRALCTIAGEDRIKDLDKVAPEVPPPEDTGDQPELKAVQSAPASPSPTVQETPEEAKPTGWTDYTSKEGGFLISLPSGKAVDQNPQMDTPVGKLSFHIHGVEIGANEAVFLTNYSDYPDVYVASGEEKMFDSAKTGLTTSMQGAKVSSESKVTIEGHPGREYLLDVTNGNHFKCRVFLVKNRVIMLLAGGKPGKVNDKDIQTFFDSFKLTRK